jgi:uncharacterized protein (TIGR02231 family)
LHQSLPCGNSEKFLTLWKNPFFAPYDKFGFFNQEYYSLIKNKVMKTGIVTSLAISLICLPLLASEPLDVNSQIKEVTVFLHGAQITRQANCNLTKGTTVLAFRELPVNLDPQSIQASGEGNFVILSLLHQVNYLAGTRKTAPVKALQDTLRVLEDNLAQANGKQAVLKSEEELLIANRNLGGNDRTITMAELKQAADFYRARLTEIKKDQIKLTTESGLLTQKIEKVRNQLNTMNAAIQKPTSEILVSISASENTPVKMRITYTVNDAGWFPIYDVRAKDVQNPVLLNYNARVSQNTGEDWDRVMLKLSTANPQQRGEKPDLQPWFIDFDQAVSLLNEVVVRGSGMEKRAYAAPMAVEDQMQESAEMAAPLAATAASLTEAGESQTNLEFNILIPYDIPSDSRQYTISIQESTLPATFEYYCAPKVDREAFLLARITGWENLNLLSGEINLFFEGTYVGKSSLNIRNTNDTLDLSLGRDKGIVVTRVKMKDYTEEKTIGSNKRESRAWEITVRNTKRQALNLRLEDQLPVSMNKDIELEPLDFSGGSYNKETGRVTWKLKLAPSEEKKLRLAFAIKYPKDKSVFID